LPRLFRLVYASRRHGLNVLRERATRSRTPAIGATILACAGGAGNGESAERPRRRVGFRAPFSCRRIASERVR